MPGDPLAPPQANSRRAGAQPANALTRFVNREIFRAAAFLCKIPFCAARATSGSALCKAVAAPDASLAAIASSTLRTKVRIWLRRDLFTAVRRSILRTAFWADLVLAMNSQPFFATAYQNPMAVRPNLYGPGPRPACWAASIDAGEAERQQPPGLLFAV